MIGVLFIVAGVLNSCSTFLAVYNSGRLASFDPALQNDDIKKTLFVEARKLLERAGEQDAIFLGSSGEIIEVKRVEKESFMVLVGLRVKPSSLALKIYVLATEDNIRRFSVSFHESGEKKVQIGPHEDKDIDFQEVENLAEKIRNAKNVKPFHGTFGSMI